MLANQKVITIYHRRMNGYKGAISEDLAEYQERGKSYVLMNPMVSVGGLSNGIQSKQSTLRGQIRESIHNLTLGDKVVCENKTYYINQVSENGMMLDILANG